MKLSALMLSLVVVALAGCASTGTGKKKEEAPAITAGRSNVQLGTAYLQQGNYTVARDKLERALKQNPRDPDVHTSLGLLYDRTNEKKLADKHFREALRLAPDRPELGNNYAIYLCKNGRTDEGVERFTEVAASKYYRTPEVALTNAGVCLRAAKRYEAAEAKFLGAIKARPNYTEATVQLANMHLERSQLVEARKVVDTFLNAFRPDPEVLFAAVTVARAAKDKLGEEKYSRALRLEFPDSAQARALKRGT